MIATEMHEIIEKTEQLSQLIISSDLALEFINSRQIMHNDDEVQRMIRAFNIKKDAYDEVQRFGRHHPDFLKVRKETFAMKREIEQHPIVSRFLKAEEELDELLYEISKMIAFSVSPTIKVPGNNPFFTGSGCGSGGCGSGGPCGCK